MPGDSPFAPTAFNVTNATLYFLLSPTSRARRELRPGVVFAKRPDDRGRLNCAPGDFEDRETIRPSSRGATTAPARKRRQIGDVHAAEAATDTRANATAESSVEARARALYLGARTGPPTRTRACLL